MYQICGKSQLKSEKFFQKRLTSVLWDDNIVA
nr:MAG TPA: hypothetical protein [Caudoviricetes sp.]